MTAMGRIRAVMMLALGTVAMAASPGPAVSADFVPAVVYDMGGKFDKSFNEAAYRGAERFAHDTGIAYRDFGVTNETQREQGLRTLARRGATVVVAMGFAQAAPLEKVAREFPDTKFCLIDEKLDLPNVRSLTFKEHEGSFLVGILAAMASRTGTVGFVGGMDIPLIRNFLAGYEQGVRHTRPDGAVIVNMAGTTPTAWRDPARGAELAVSQFGRGADVVFAAAGATGLGVLQAAADAGKLGIGVDSNQNHLHPGKVLTSMIKRVDVAVYDCFAAARAGTWTAGHQALGLKEDGVGYAIDEHNRALISPAMEKAVEEARAGIIAGTLTVQPYQP